MNPHLRFVGVLLGLCAATLAVILTLNLQLGARALGSPEMTRLASAWQERSRGVTYAPPVWNNRAFKSLRLNDRIHDVNAIVFGSSTMMGFVEGTLSPHFRSYNFSQSGNPLGAMIGEAEYILERWPGRVKGAVIPLDWALGFIYENGTPQRVDLASNAAQGQLAASRPSFLAQVADALAYPRVKTLFKLLLHVATTPDPLAGFRGTFLDRAGSEYLCPEGMPARDFDVINRGACSGFRYDGSWTFGGEKRLTPQRGAILARAAAAPSSKYSRFLCKSGGEPNPVYLARLAAISRRLANDGGIALFYLPPLVPGMERQMTAEAGSRACLARTREVLNEWALAHHLTVIDAGESERYGCLPGEFLDEHHAYPECHARVFARYRADRAAGRAGPGLYRADGDRGAGR